MLIATTAQMYLVRAHLVVKAAEKFPEQDEIERIKSQLVSIQSTIGFGG
jgi:hypothetical protein